MTVFQAIILGLIQGLTEFIPVSSSGHLILIREILGVGGNYLLFDVMLHVATLLAICAVFFKELLALFRPPFKTLGLLIIATIPAGIVAFAYSAVGSGMFESAKYLCFTFLISAVILFFAEIIGKRIKNPKDINLKTASCMGLMQVAAILPGITRSGSTIFGGIAAGGERSKIAKFSFFMSAPIILAAAVFEGVNVGSGESVVWYAMALGMFTAFISGFLAIKLMLKLISKANFKWFSLYLAALSVITFFVYFL